MRSRRVALFAVAAALPLALLVPSAGANHSWGNYHWARTSNPFTLKVGDNVPSTWDAYLNEAIGDWSQSPVLDLTKVQGATTSKRCRPTAGQIEACADRYGYNGWLGIAQIWASGSHITQAIVKMNDSYFASGTYNTPAWRRLVMCQEIGHDFGLDHQDENFNNANLGTCMDYTNDPDGGAGGASNSDPSNEHPDSHDFQQVQAIYSHVDNTSTVSSATSPSGTGKARSEAGGGNSQADWGTAIGYDGAGRPDLFVQELPSGQRLFTHVFWAS